MLDLTVQDSGARGWTVRFLDRAEYAELKQKEEAQFGKLALRAATRRQNWPDSKVWEGALIFHEGRVIHLRPADINRWLARRELRRVQL